jgi:peptidoglycan DL-endopeptidase LytF
MLKKYIILAALLISTTVSFAYKPIDSIGVENNNGKKLIIHKVEAKETYYSISRRYNVNPKDVITFNDSKYLQIGVIIKVPTDLPFSTKTVTSSVTSNNDSGFFEYTVMAKDNLNLIAEKYATTVSEIKRLNNLSSNNLQVGQSLKVPFTNTNSTNKAPNQAPASQPAVISTGNATEEHKVKAKENLNLIANQYGTTVEEIKRLNALTSNNLQIGQVLIVPTTKTEVVSNTPKPSVAVPTVSKAIEAKVESPTGSTKTDPSFEHIVSANETIYSIAKKYQLTTYQLKNFNNLTSNELTVGQKLIIKGEKPLVATADETDEEPTDAAVTLKNPSLKKPASTYGLNRIEEKGTGVWISDPDLDPNKMLILHRTAPVGTIIQITNPMTNRSTFAKVVGKFTENENTKDVIIVMTKAVADAVGALDKRFFCNLSYGPKDNEK